MARDLVRVIQDARKEQGCEFTDRIEIGMVTESPELRTAIEKFNDHIAGETLADRIELAPIEGCTPSQASVGGQEVALYLRVVS